MFADLVRRLPLVKEANDAVVVHQGCSVNINRVCNQKTPSFNVATNITKLHNERLQLRCSYLATRELRPIEKIENIGQPCRRGHGRAGRSVSDHSLPGQVTPPIKNSTTRNSNILERRVQNWYRNANRNINPLSTGQSKIGRRRPIKLDNHCVFIS